MSDERSDLVDDGLDKVDDRRDKVDDRRDRVYERLDRVLDPCSCLTERPLSIVELGLVEHVAVDGGCVSIELVPTSPVCLYMAQIIEEVTEEVSRLDDVDEVVVEQTIDVLWRPERMDPNRLQEKQARAEERVSELSSR